MGLTDLLIKKLKAPEKGQKTYFDDDPRGFGVRVSQGGTKSFVLKYGKKRNLVTLGKYPDLTLAKARREAKLMQGKLLSEPLPSDTLPTTSFPDAIDAFIEDTKKRTKASTHNEYERLLKRHFSFDKNLAEITRNDVMKAVSALSDKPSIEQHAFVAIRTMMNWSVRHGFLNYSPVPMRRYSTTSRSRILTDDELKVVWRRAEEVGYPYGRIVQLLVLTGQRRGEIAGLRRSWMDDESITFPEGFTKNKREHRIPIGPITKQLIDCLPDDTDLLFPSRHNPETPFNGWSKAKRHFDEPLDMPPWTLHDLRRTYSSNLARLGVPLHVTEKLLNHVSGTISGVAAVYNRHSYLVEMKDAIAVYQDHICSITVLTKGHKSDDNSSSARGRP